MFDQPYPYHAGFDDQGYLYNDRGNLTLVWSMLDPVRAELFPGQRAWALNLLYRRRFEALLLPAPIGIKADHVPPLNWYGYILRKEVDR